MKAIISKLDPKHISSAAAKDLPDNITIYYKTVLKANGKKGVGFKILSTRPDSKEWFAQHLKKNIN